jgi:hypothetical protein
MGTFVDDIMLSSLIQFGPIFGWQQNLFLQTRKSCPFLLSWSLHDNTKYNHNVYIHGWFGWIWNDEQGNWFSCERFVSCEVDLVHLIIQFHKERTISALCLFSNCSRSRLSTFRFTFCHLFAIFSSTANNTGWDGFIYVFVACQSNTSNY